MRSDTRVEITAAVDRTLREEALRNERMIAVFRFAAFGATALADFASYLFPRATLRVDHVPFRLPLITFALAGYALAVLLLLRRRGYPSVLRTTLPLLDGLAIFVGFANARWVLGDARFVAVGGLATVAASCALLALGGGLRLTRSVVALSTFAAVAVFSAFALDLADPSHNYVIQVAILLVVGAVGGWIGRFVGRSTESAVARATLGRFLPEHLVEQAYRDPLALLAEARSVEAAVVVTDLRGFTSLAETMPPGRVLDFLSDLQGRLAEVVRRHGGTVDKFLGDGMLAVFGALDVHPAPSAAAIRAAREMVETVAEIDAARRAEGLPGTALGVGVHAGPLVAGCIGSGARLEFTVLGDTVNTASRLQDLSKELGAPIVASEEAIRRAGDAATGRFRSRGEVTLRGRHAPITVYTAD
jgi:class 3 adenylate cyclase